ncbi:hypothetical protein EZS27_000042 [termite gut metagenome]|uniref:Uncharacterized protein n=1 Tax=termite gut metagenome TaxID=433724 RepID=A0A5J4T4Z2_9ZZZZ
MLLSRVQKNSRNYEWSGYWKVLINAVICSFIHYRK